jgi:hypothetical protein
LRSGIGLEIANRFRKSQDIPAVSFGNGPQYQGYLDLVGRSHLKGAGLRLAFIPVRQRRQLTIIASDSLRIDQASGFKISPRFLRSGF